MLGIILCYYNCPEYLPIQLKNFKKYVKTPYTVFVIDDSPNGLTELNRSDVIYAVSKKNSSWGPSGRHQSAVNQGLRMAKSICDTFLIFDNDMIFLDPFYLPNKTFYLARKVGTITHMWMNLIFLHNKNKIPVFDFYQCPVTGYNTDSGGTSCHFIKNNALNTEKIEDLTAEKEIHYSEYFEALRVLLNKYNLQNLETTPFQLLRLNKSRILHFSSMSNWNKISDEFLQEKKELTFKYANEINIRDV